MGAPEACRSLAVLGSTGALGRAALTEALAHPDRLRIVALAAGENAEALADQALEIQRVCGELPALAMASARGVEALRSRLGTRDNLRLLCGPEGLGELASDPAVDIVLCAISGLAAFPAAEGAARAGRLLLLASKEVLALAGRALSELAAKQGGCLEPLDSELTAAASLIARHGPLVPAGAGEARHRLLLTASGGPLWSHPEGALGHHPPELVLRHPIWALGPKIAVDSATQLNKAHEVVAAAQLFGLHAEDVSVAIQPEPTIHAVLGLPDGSEAALAGPPEMQGALRALLGLPSPRPLEGWSLLGSTPMQPIDPIRFPGIALGHRALARGAAGRVALVSANEAAVGAFLAGQLPLPGIAAVVGEALDSAPECPEALSDLWAAALEARRTWSRRLERVR